MFCDPCRRCGHQEAHSQVNVPLTSIAYMDMPIKLESAAGHKGVRQAWSHNSVLWMNCTPLLASRASVLPATYSRPSAVMVKEWEGHASARCA